MALASFGPLLGCPLLRQAFLTPSDCSHLLPLALPLSSQYHLPSNIELNVFYFLLIVYLPKQNASSPRVGVIVYFVPAPLPRASRDAWWLVFT